MKDIVARYVVVVALVVATAGPAFAQRGRGAGASGPAQSPQAAAPIDLTGYWVTIVTEDWRWRMVTPPKGDYASIQNLMTPEARKLADAWDPATDGSCLAFGGAGLMRMPTRLNIAWENENTLKIDTDAGQQTRRLLFDRSVPVPAAKSLQGHSVAEWERPGGGGGRGGAPPGPAPAAAAPRAGNLKVVTTNLSGGWLRRNGVPYSDSTMLTEYYDRFTAPDGGEWLVVTSVVNDAKYLTQEFVTSSHFRREPNGQKWDPSPCK
jgi:hypothetical protein